MQKIGNILPSIFTDFGIEDAVKLKFLRKRWDTIFTQPVSDNTFPKELKNNTLYVIVNSHAWLNELKLLKDEFAKKLHPYGVLDVEFRFGRVYRNQKKKTEEKAFVLSSEDEKWMKEIVSNIKNEEIKATTESLVKKYLMYISKKQTEESKSDGV